MGAESIDYTPIIADLENKKAAIERTIALLRQLMTMGDLAQVGEGGIVSSAVSSFTGGEVPTGAFLGKSIIEATRLYLEIVKKKQTAKQIMDGLLRGGMESSRPKSFLKTVHSALTRARQAPNPPFVKVGTQWGLTGWFPKGIATGGSAKKATKKATKKAAKKAASQGNAPPKVSAGTEAQPKPHNRNSPIGKQILDTLRSKVGAEFSSAEIAERLKADVRKVNLIMGNFVRGGSVEKTTNGKFRHKSQEKAVA